MNGAMLGSLLTFLLFGAAGVLAAMRLNMPVGAWTWLILAIAVALGSWIGISTAIVSVTGVTLSLNWAIVSFSLAMLVTLLVRTRTFAGARRTA